MLDYDYTPLPRVKNIIKKLQLKFDLGVGHIARTGVNRHHVAFFDRLPEWLWKQVIQESQCHDGYGFHLLEQKYAILRLIAKGVESPAPKWIYAIPTRYPPLHKQSQLHAQILQKFWNIPSDRLDVVNPDNNVLWEEVYYFTDNKRHK